MPVLRTLGATIRLAIRAARGVAGGGIVVGRHLGRGVLAVRSRGGGGEPGMLRLLDLHAASCAGDTLVAIGLAGTVFFAVPAGEARGRVAMYLLVTMLPFALLAPVIGPVLDRFRHGRRYAMAVTMLGRAFLAYMISEHLTGFTLYPAAFGVLVLSRAYGVARSASVPRVLPTGLGLSEAGARASVYGTIAGAIAAPIGLAAAGFGPEWSLRISTVVFVFGMVTALRLPPRADSDPPEVAPRLFRRPGQRTVRLLAGRGLIAALLGSAALRAMYGFLMLFLAFAVRAQTMPTRIATLDLRQTTALGAVAGAMGIGSFVATSIGTVLRIRRPVRLQAIGLALVAASGTWAAVRHGFVWVLLLCFLTAIASGLAKLAVDATIQERIAEQVRSSAFAHSETLLMIAWVLGGALGLVPIGGWVGVAAAAGFSVLAAGATVVAAVRLRADRLAGAHDAGAAGSASAAAGTASGAAGDAAAGTKPTSAASPKPPGRGGLLSRMPSRGRPRSPALDQPDEDQPASERPASERPASQRPARDRPAGDRAKPAQVDIPIQSPGYHLYRPTSLDREQE